MEDAGTPTPYLRRAPVQARSRDRLRLVLHSAEQVLAEEGAAALTTTRVAEVAGIPVGSLYHYFPDKQAIVEALAVGYWSDFDDLVGGICELDENEPLADPAGTILDTLAAGFRARPAFLALWYGGLRTEQVRDATRPVRTSIGRSIERILARRRPEADPAVRATVAATVVLVGDGLLREAFRIDPDGEPDLLEEGKRVLRAYIAARLG